MECDLLLHRRMSTPTFYKLEKIFPTLFTLNHYNPPSPTMAHPTDAQQFVSVYDPNPPRTRQPSGLLGSIWAPQPQPSDTTWPRTLDSFSRVAEREAEHFSRCDIRNGAFQPIISREDVFGPQPTQKVNREIGAIGDGRKKNSPDYDDKVGFFPFFSSIKKLIQVFFAF